VASLAAMLICKATISSLRGRVRPIAGGKLVKGEVWLPLGLDSGEGIEHQGPEIKFGIVIPRES